MACARSKLPLKPSGLYIAVWSTDADGRVVAKVKCETGFSFVRIRGSTEVLEELEYFCHPQYTAIFVNDLFGHYVPQCVGK